MPSPTATTTTCSDTAPFVVNGSTFQVVNTGLFDDEDEDGFTVGGHVGYNFQFGAFVVGAEADIEWVDVGRWPQHHGEPSRPCGVPVEQFTVSLGSDLEFIGSLRARLGWAWDRALIYATGGLAYASFDTGDNNFLGSELTRSSRTATTTRCGAGPSAPVSSGPLRTT